MKKQKNIFGIYITLLVILVCCLYFLNKQSDFPKKQKTLAAATTTTLPDLLFTPDSPWNQPIGSNVQIDPNSSTWVNAISPGSHIATVFGFGMPIYVSTASDPSYTVKDGDPSDKAFQANQPFHIPDTAAPAPGDSPSDADHWMFVYDTTKGILYEMWQANKSGSTWSDKVANAFTITGDGVKQVDGSVTDGNGGSYFAGVITHQDITRGYINHSLSLVTPDTASTFRAPLTQSDGSGSGSSAIPEGARLQLDPTFDCSSMSGASVGEIMVCKALQTYGGYIRDTGAGGGTNLTIYFEGEDLTDPNRKPPTNPGDGGRSGGPFGTVGISDGTDFSHIPWTKLRVLKAWNSYAPVTGTPTPTPTGTPTPTAPGQGSGTPNPTGMILAVQAYIHGIGQGGDNANSHSTGNTTPLHTIRPVTVTVLNASNQVVITQQGNLSYDTTTGSFKGTISMGNLASGNYLLKIKADGTLGKYFSGIQTITQGITNTLPPIYLVTGDINNDNQLDILDYNILINCFGTKQQTTSCTNPPTQQTQGADIDDNASVNGADYNLFLRELSVHIGE